MPGIGQDQDFLNALSDQQHAYLMATDKDYAKAPPDQQKEYLRSFNNIDPKQMEQKSLQQATTSKTNNAITQGSESQGADYLASLSGHDKAPASGAEAVDQLKGTLGKYGGAEASLYSTGFAPSTATAMRSAAGGITGGYLGGKVGGYFGGMIGPEAGKWGERIGALGGGLVGGLEGYRSVPKVEPEFTPISESPHWNEMKAAYKSPVAPKVQAELGSPENPGFHSKLPTTMPKPAAIAKPTDELTQAVKEGRAARLPVRISPPQEAPTIDPVTQAVKERRAAYIPTRMPKIAEPETPSIIQPGVEPPTNASNQDLISRTRRPILSGEQPHGEDLKRAGDLTQAPLWKLQQLKKFGDKLAENEINRRLKN